MRSPVVTIKEIDGFPIGSVGAVYWTDVDGMTCVKFPNGEFKIIENKKLKEANILDIVFDVVRGLFGS